MRSEVRNFMTSRKKALNEKKILPKIKKYT